MPYYDETEIKVRYSETDQMGIVHHSRYFPWFEVGRTEFFKKSGLSYGNIEKAGIFFPVIESRCFYKKGAKYEDELIIRTHIAELSGGRCRFAYEVIKKGDGALVAKGYTEHAFTGRDYKPVNVKKAYPDLWNRMYEFIN